MTAQGEFSFGNGSTDQGYTRWLDQRKQAAIEVARQIHLPLDRQVEVWLVGGVRLRGKLLLQEEKLFLGNDDVQHHGLSVDHVPFSIHEMESCVRLDWLPTGNLSPGANENHDLAGKRNEVPIRPLIREQCRRPCAALGGGLVAARPVPPSASLASK
jgi:hypothetical protein